MQMQKYSRKSISLLICVVLSLATWAAYWHLGRHQFINYDDQDYLTNNPDVQAGLSWKAAVWAFTTDYAGNWHPLTWLSHMLDCQLYGMNAGGHHITNLLLHIANTLLLFLVLQRMTGAIGRSAAVAALFALHPLHVESVAWASERKDVLSAFFFMLTLWTYCRYAKREGRNSEFRGQKPEVRSQNSEVGIQNSEFGTQNSQFGSQSPSSIFHPPSWIWYCLSVLLFACGLMSKPMLVTLPFLLLLIDFWPLQRWQFPIRQPSAGSAFSTALRLILEKAPFLALAAISCVVTFIVQRKTGTVSSMDVLPLDTRIENALASYLLYIGKTLWPVHLAPFYPYLPERPFGLVGFAAAALLGITAMALTFAKRMPYLAVGWFWYAGMLVPVIGLVQVGIQSMADRYTYLPSLGLFIAAVWGISDLAGRWSAGRIVLRASTAVVLIVCLVLTLHQVARWENSEALFRHTLKVTTDNPVAHHCLGCVLVEQGKIEEAEQHFAETVRLKPGNFEARNNLGLALVIRGKLNEAIDQYEEVLKAHPDFEKTHYNLGRALELQGNRDAAIPHYRRALELKPNFAEPRDALADALSGQGQHEEALKQFIMLAQLKPSDAAIRIKLAALLDARGNVPEAISNYVAGLQLNPADPDAHEQLGMLLARNGRVAEAVPHFEAVLRLRPNAQAHYNLALALVVRGDTREAVTHYRKALELSPDWPPALNDLAWILATHPDPALRNGAEAVRLAERACELTARKEARFLGTLDAAYAEAGSFAEACRTAEQARQLALASNANDLAGAAERRLELYRAGKAFRQ
jgi:tetratricopeptide (TPR) repeat protein